MSEPVAILAFLFVNFGLVAQTSIYFKISLIKSQLNLKFKLICQLSFN